MSTRVQISPSSDLWMRGARYGTIEKWHSAKDGKPAIVSVRLDHPQVHKRLYRFRLNDVEILVT